MRSSELLVSALLCCVLLSGEDVYAEEQGSAGFVPPEDGKDWLRLVSGELLRGELIGVLEDSIEFDSDVLDDLVIDAEDVEDFYTTRVFSVSIRDSEVITGRVRVNADTIIVETRDGPVQFPRERLVAAAASAERERDRWTGDIGLGFNARQGNTDFIEYNTIAGLERRTARSRVLIDYVGHYNETEGVEVANSHRSSLVFDRFSGSRFFWRPITSQYFRDPFQNIKHQGTLETGLGYEMIDNKRTEWDFFASAGVNYVTRISVEEGQSPNRTSPSLSIGTDFDTELTSWLDYLFSFTATFVDEESGNYQHHMLTTLSTDLFDNLDMDITLEWNRTEDPPPLADGSIPEQDDFRLLVGLSYDF